jgi:hypothetical protein
MCKECLLSAGIFFFLFMEWGIKLRASHMLGRCSYSLSHSASFLCCGYFLRSDFARMRRLAWTRSSLYLSAPSVSGTRCINAPSYSLRWDFPGLSLNHDLADLHLRLSQDYSMSHSSTLSKHLFRN